MQRNRLWFFLLTKDEEASTAFTTQNHIVTTLVCVTRVKRVYYMRSVQY